MTKKLLGLALLLLTLTGCVTHRPRQANHPVPPARVFNPALLQSSPKRNCAITMTREPGVVGAGLNIYLDGNHLARIAAGESITAFLRPGRHTVSARPLFSPATSRLLTLKDGEKIALLIVDRDGNFQLQLRGENWTSAMKSWLSATPAAR